MSIKYSDSGFLDGADSTKKLSFDVSGVTTGTTRTITMPDANVDLSSVGTPDDNSVTLTKMAGGTDGNLITYDASGDPAYVTTGTSGQVLTSGGAGVAPTFQAAAAGGATDIDGLSDGTTSGTGNTGLGSAALDSLTSGSNNTAVGTNALTNSTTTNWSSAFGKDALATAGNAWSNDAFGFKSLSNISPTSGPSSGSNNCAFGFYSGLNVSLGHSNTLIGCYAGDLITTGYKNSCIGHLSDPSSSGSLYQFTLGDATTTNLRCNDTSISSLSDQRDKAEITDLPESAGLDIINALRPVTYFWDRREWYEDGTPDGSKIKPDYRRWKTNSGLKYGFIAQEVQATIADEKCMADSGIVTDDNPDRLEFAPQHLLTNAIKAIQQLSAEMEILKSEIATLKGV